VYHSEPSDLPLHGARIALQSVWWLQGGVLLQLVRVKVRALGGAIAYRISASLKLDYYDSPARPFFGRSCAAFFCKILYHHRPYHHCLPSHLTTTKAIHHHAYSAALSLRGSLAKEISWNPAGTAAPRQHSSTQPSLRSPLTKASYIPSLSSLPCSVN
jgi:hypothetical protein